LAGWKITEGRFITINAINCERKMEISMEAVIIKTIGEIN